MKSVSRQRAWQKRKVAEGRCRTCGKPRGESTELCDKHLRLNRERIRRRKGVSPDRYNLKYRWTTAERERIAASMKAEYEAGETLISLAVRHRVGEPTVRKILKAAGVTLRRQGRRPKGETK